MRRWAIAGLVLLLCGMVTTASAKKKKDPQASRLFCQAQYAYVGTTDGDVMNPNVLPQDREAADALMNNLQAWKRYVIVYQPREADLVFVVRSGRLASLQGHVVAGGQYPNGRNPGPGMQDPSASQNPPGTRDPGAAGEYPQGPGIGVGAAAEAGPPNDLLQVYTNGDVTDNAHTMLWERSQADGLQGSQPLFEHLRDAVEKSCLDFEKSKSGHWAPGSPDRRSAREWFRRSAPDTVRDFSFAASSRRCCAGKPHRGAHRADP